ncbi:glycosyltransferase family 4 protein [Massilia sp. S19_KUP03_FR1]|uniref:glycosyltransferase family 4 protein n=1 Tax=Massilia sp. S19_KUP03_FR1 TaxID=3025503 RepID=UPI002FCDB893
MNKKIVISVNAAWNIHNFRSGLVKALIRHGYEIMVMAPDDRYSRRLSLLGCRFKVIHMDNNGTSPSHDLALLVKYWRVLQSVRPLAYLGYTIKPNVYGSIAAHGLGIPVINNIAGLGTTFINQTFITSLVKRLYRFSLRKSNRVFFQNSDDLNLFVQAGLIQPGTADVLPGSGIDLNHFSPSPLHRVSKRGFRFLLVSRMLRDKGIEEFVAAAEIVRKYMPAVQFQLLGPVDEKNPNAVSLEKIKKWERDDLVSYLDETDDVRPYLNNADCIVLPSYREGTPHSLLEAAAMERPIITTDVAGCREVVDHDDNGFLCKAKDANDLAEKMMQMVHLSHEQRLAMGVRGRMKVVTEFDENIVIEKYLNAIRQLEFLGRGSSVRLAQPSTETIR